MSTTTAFLTLEQIDAEIKTLMAQREAMVQSTKRKAEETEETNESNDNESPSSNSSDDSDNDSDSKADDDDSKADDDDSVSGSYWAGDGPLQKEYDVLYETLVPACGSAKTLNGELIRGIGRLGHEYNNNGNCNAWSKKKNDGYWNVSGYYSKFLRLIASTVPFTSVSCSPVAEIIANAFDSNSDDDDNEDYDHKRAVERAAERRKIYFSKENQQAYDDLFTHVIYHVLKTPDTSTFPEWYVKE